MVEWFGGRCSIWFSSTQWSTCLIQTNLNAFLFWWLGKFFLYTEIDFEPIITVALFIRRYSLHQNLIISAVDQPKSNVFNFLPPSNSPLSYPTSHHNTIISLNFHCVCPLVHIIPPTISLETTRKDSPNHHLLNRIVAGWVSSPTHQNCLICQEGCCPLNRIKH